MAGNIGLVVGGNNVGEVVGETVWKDNTEEAVVV